MLEEQLLKHGIKSVVEESSVSEVLNKNKWKYASSYKVTKTFLEKAKENKERLKLIDEIIKLFPDKCLSQGINLIQIE